MNKTFDQLFAEIVGENIMAPTQQQKQQAPAQQATPTANPGQQQAQQPQQSSAPVDLKKISTELAGITDAAQIEKVLAGLLNPNAANQQA